MHRIIYMKDEGKYSVIFTDKNNSDFILYMMQKKDKKIVYFSTTEGAEKAIEDLGNTEFSLYYMGK